MITKETDIKDLAITVMGLGLHGGGLATARYLASRGAKVTVTDLRSSEVLKPSIKALQGLPVKFVLGEHRMEDFESADLVVKNPAVPHTSPYLKGAKQIESDISLFLRLNKRPVLAVTGSKGKSTTTSALHHILKTAYSDCRLGGNITISPLTFLEEAGEDGWNSQTDPVILELSSWQLADLAGKGVLSPEITAITNILKDHQDRYNGMDEYVADKMAIFQEQQQNQITLCPAADAYGLQFSKTTPARALFFSPIPLSETEEGAWLTPRGGGIMTEEGWTELLPENLAVPGEHNRINCLTAATMAWLFGMDAEKIRKALESFTGIGHRLEFVRTWQGVRFYNDSAATIPDAVAAALRSFSAPLFLITGGTDKDLDFTPLRKALPLPTASFLLAGSAQEKFISEYTAQNLSFQGPYDSLKKAFDQAVREAQKKAVTNLPDPKPGSEAFNNAPVVLLSPGCASFGMFLNEFDRGRQFIELVQGL